MPRERRHAIRPSPPNRSTRSDSVIEAMSPMVWKTEPVQGCPQVGVYREQVDGVRGKE